LEENQECAAAVIGAYDEADAEAAKVSRADSHNDADPSVYDLAIDAVFAEV
jgi:hypothetical protein